MCNRANLTHYNQRTDQPRSRFLWSPPIPRVRRPVTFARFVAYAISAGLLVFAAATVVLILLS